MKKYILVAALMVCALSLYGADKVNRLGRGIQATGGTSDTSAFTLIATDSTTNEYAFVVWAPTVSGVSSATTTTFTRPFVATPTIVQQTARPFFSAILNSESVLTSASTVSATATTAAISGINSTTLNNLKFLFYGIVRQGTFN